MNMDRSKCWIDGYWYNIRMYRLIPINDRNDYTTIDKQQWGIDGYW